jgi:hypothetical protein
MRLALALSGSTLESLATQAVAAEAAGIDIAWLESDDRGQTGFLQAAALSARTTSIRLAASVPVGEHPLAIAEAAAVADNCSNGRLILILEDRLGDPELLAESADVVLAGLTTRPFNHRGARWTIPAQLPENDQHEARVIVTPHSVQPELPVWLMGPSADEVARTRGLTVVATADADPADLTRAWTAAETMLGSSVVRLRRPGVFELELSGEGTFDDDALVAMLTSAQRGWGMDIAVLRPPRETADSVVAAIADRVSSHVRPRVTMDALAVGLEQHWREVLPQ